MQYSILSQAVTTQTVVKRKSNSCKAHKRRTQSLTRVSDSFNLEQTRFSLYRFTLNHRRGSTLQISLVILFQTPDLLKKMFHSFVFCSLCFWHLAVFCDAVQMISVMDGHSVTLQTNTEIQKEDLLMWKFGAEKSLIAEINAEAGSFNTYDVPDGRFRDRLELDKKTGSLTITNTTTEHAGLYLITISGKTVTEYRFNVTVYVFCKGMKTVSVMEGDSVTLQTNVTEIQKEDLLMWKFGAEKSLIAEINAEARRFNTYDVPDERFRDRLQLDHQTGSLTITNIRTEHTGHYEVIISGKTVTEYRFSVMVYGTAHVNPVLISTVATGSLLTIAVVWIFCICKRLRKTAEEVQSCEEQVTYADPTYCNQNSPKTVR
uniref:Immunoglobulin domain-containing protein n=1 Tax=Cyprinus carpio TaxID=7962 RepID=A0A8C2EPZ8_CYPCA